MTCTPDTIPSTGNLFRALPDIPRQACTSSIKTMYNQTELILHAQGGLRGETSPRNTPHCMRSNTSVLGRNRISIFMVQAVPTKLFSLHFYPRQVSVFPPVWDASLIDTSGIISYIYCEVKFYWQFVIHLLSRWTTFNIIKDAILIARSLSLPCYAL